MTLPGDVLLVSAFISYVGCFMRRYRQQLMNDDWVPTLEKSEVNPMAPIIINPFYVPTVGTRVSSSMTGRCRILFHHVGQFRINRGFEDKWPFYCQILSSRQRSIPFQSKKKKNLAIVLAAEDRNDAGSRPTVDADGRRADRGLEQRGPTHRYYEH